jgi:23S rRNA-/tRNA-specific pseudouridylate synthase
LVFLVTGASGEPRKQAVTSPADRIQSAAMPLPPILYEDDTLIVFDKPSGLAVAPDRRDGKGGNLMDQVHAARGRELASAHRLDTAASGVQVCVKTKPALDFVSGQFQSKTVVQKYSALVVLLDPERAMKVVAPVRAPAGGLPAEFTVDLALGEDSAHPGRMVVLRKRGGKPSQTEFRVREAFGKFASLECRPVTGRTHQIRLHLAAAGAPVLNDPLYGDPEERLLLSALKRRYKGRDEERPLIARLALHAGELTIVHPATKSPLTLTAPLPHEFAVALKYLRRYAVPGLAKR